MKQLISCEELVTKFNITSAYEYCSRVNAKFYELASYPGKLSEYIQEGMKIGEVLEWADEMETFKASTEKPKSEHHLILRVLRANDTDFSGPLFGSQLIVKDVCDLVNAATSAYAIIELDNVCNPNNNQGECYSGKLVIGKGYNIAAANEHLWFCYDKFTNNITKISETFPTSSDNEGIYEVMYNVKPAVGAFTFENNLRSSDDWVTRMTNNGVDLFYRSAQANPKFSGGFVQSITSANIPSRLDFQLTQDAADIPEVTVMCRPYLKRTPAPQIYSRI